MIAPRSPRGYSLQMVLMLLAVLAVAVGAMLAALVASGRTTGDMLNRRRSFYACDGMSRVVVSLAQEYIGSDASPTSEELKDYVCARGGGCDGDPMLPDITPPGFSVTSFDIQTPSAGENGVIPSGPFQGMRGLLQGIEFQLRSEKDSSGFVCEADQSVTLGQIAMFQFLLFGDGYVDWFPGADQDARGRAHANGDFCFGSTQAFRLSRVTSAGKLVASDHPACRERRGGHEAARVARDSSFTSFSGWTNSVDHGCTNCGGSGLGWAAYAAATWGNNVQDEAHGVPRLRLPITGTPETQPGRTAKGTKVSNDENSRLLVDPVRVDDAPDVRRQKLACKADIRIINGVWYLRESPTESDPCDWPGTPIWSDHPGSFPSPVLDENGVETYVRGQGDLKAERGWSDTPFRFSYYRTNPSSPPPSSYLLDPDLARPPVISYGSLFRQPTSPPAWRPGHWVAGGSSLFCTSTTSGFTSGFKDALDNSSGAVSSTCGAGLGHGVFGGFGTRLLNATRSGFQDGHVEKKSPGDWAQRWPRSRVLPVNFDVNAFIGALLDTNTGELGSYFGPGSLTGREFNGIVYVTSTWPGSMDGMDDDNYAADWPHHGNLDNSPSQPAVHAAAQRALPQPLCAVPSSSSHWEPDDGFDRAGGAFRVPRCSGFASSGAWPNALRVINARDLRPADPSVLPKGLTIATNLPAYLLGDVNATSDVSSESATPWKPFLIAADQVMMLSNNWNDARARWDQTSGSTTRNATATTYHVAMLAGWAETEDGVYSGGVENFPRFLERWAGVDHHLVGSLVVGFNSVYYRWARDGSVYSAPTRHWGFDQHFNAIPNQPPGAPLYDVYAIKRWRR